MEIQDDLSDMLETKPWDKFASIIKQDGERAKREILQESEQELLRLIDDKLNAAIRNLKCIIIHHIPKIKGCINNVMERGLASEIANIQETECSDDFIFNQIPQYSRIIFVPINDDLMQQVNSGLGEIQAYSKTDHTMSTIQVESDPEALMRKEKLILITKTSTWDLNDDTSDVADVKISPKDNVKMEEKYARTDGEIQFEFMPKVVGQLTAVKVNGRHVSNSPLHGNESKATTDENNKTV